MAFDRESKGDAMEMRFHILIDVSAAPFAFSAGQLRKALERMHAGDILKVRARSERDGGDIRAVAKEAECDVVCSGISGYFYECLIRRAKRDDRQG